MLSSFSDFFHRLRLIRSCHFEDESSQILISKSTRAYIKPGACIKIQNGLLQIGGNYPRHVSMPSLDKNVICMEEDAVLEVYDDVFLSQGAYINIKKGGHLVFKGGNFIGHNCRIICKDRVEVGKNSSTSWNVTLIDDDGHHLYLKDKKIPRTKRPLEIGDYVGIQMNVTIPRGVKVGNQSLLGANTVIREDIPEKKLVYTKNELKVKDDISAGLHLI